MPKSLRGTALLLLILFVALPALALDDVDRVSQSNQPSPVEQEVSDEAVIRVIPNEASIGSQHVILITGLEANESITVHIISEADDNTVYDKSLVADTRGIVEVEIFTEASDVPGEYRVEVLNANDDIIGTASFTVIEAEIFSPQVSIEPLEAEAGSIFTIEISDIRPFARLEISIDNEFGEEIFQQAIRASVDGLAVIEFQSDDENTGILSVTVIEGDINRIASIDITVLGKEYPTTIVTDPIDALPGETVYITVSGLEAETATVVNIVYDDVVVDTIDDSANISGLIIFPYTFAADVERGRYEIQVFQNEEQVGQLRLTVDILPVTVDIAPTVGTVNTVFVATVSDLRPDEAITVEFMREGEVIQSRTALADADGIARTTFGQRIALELGTYDLQVLRLGESVYSGILEVAEQLLPSPPVVDPIEATVTITPESGTIPTVYELTIEGAPADAALDISVLFNGESVFTTTGSTDENGTFTTLLNSSEGDEAGTYTVEISIEDTVIGSADFEIVAEEADSEDDTEDNEVEQNTPPVIESDVTIEISPDTLLRGERIEFIIANLVPDESVTFEMLYGDQVIYSTESIANADGATGIALIAREDEALGDYQVRVIREGEIVASNSFEIVASGADIDNAQISVDPETGQQGTGYAITVTGLAANEAVNVLVSFDGDTVYETAREADDNGAFTVVLNSDSTDEIGQYDVSIVRESGNDLEAVFTITEAETELAPPDDGDDEREATISINPDKGEIGSSHEVTVSGLAPNETFNFIIEFEGDAVYSVERSADENGNFSTSVSANEGDPIGDYQIVIAREDADDLSVNLLVTGDEQAPPDDADEESELSLTIEPDELVAGESFDVLVTGLAPDEQVSIAVDYDGETVFETQRSANDDGEIRLDLSSDEDDLSGTYTVTVSRDDEQVSADFEVSAPDETDDEEAPVDTDELNISVEPQNGEIGTIYEFTVTGLAPNTEFDIDVEFDGNTVYETTRTSNASGAYTITLETGEDDDAGTYSFIVSRDGQILGSIEFEVGSSVAVNADDEEEDDEIQGSSNEGNDEQAPVDEEDDLSESIAYTDAVELEFDENTSVQNVEFDGVAGDVISINVDSGDTLDTVATLISPSGEEIVSDDDGGPGFDPEIERVVLPDSGSYTLAIQTFNPGDAGTVAVSINRNDVRTLDDGETREINLNSKITTDILTFEGQAGEVISLIIELDEGAIGALVVSAEQNDSTLMNYETFGLPETIVLGFVVPENGTVVIRVEDDGSNRAVLNARIERE